MTLNPNLRSDRDTANTVRSGIIVLDRHGTAVAARWMRMHGVPLLVAIKVITQPWRRRSEDYVMPGQAL